MVKKTDTKTLLVQKIIHGPANRDSIHSVVCSQQTGGFEAKGCGTTRIESQYDFSQKLLDAQRVTIEIQQLSVTVAALFQSQRISVLSGQVRRVCAGGYSK